MKQVRSHKKIWVKVIMGCGFLSLVLLGFLTIESENKFWNEAFKLPDITKGLSDEEKASYTAISSSRDIMEGAWRDHRRRESVYLFVLTTVYLLVCPISWLSLFPKNKYPIVPFYIPNIGPGRKYHKELREKSRQKTL